MNRNFLLFALMVLVFLTSGCKKDNEVTVDTPIDNDMGMMDDDNTTSKIDTLTTTNGVLFVRTPDEFFQNLPDWSYAYQYIEIDGLRQAYAEAGPADGEVVLLLHGQPSWSYLYRKMIPVLADAGYRVIAMDHLGMGRSDKPVDISAYSYLGHGDRLEKFIQQLGLSDINLFVQDWGSLIGLRVAGLNPDWFATISVGDGVLPVVPQGFQVINPIENPNEIEDIPSLFTDIPAQQIPYYDGCDLIIDAPSTDFEDWANYAMKGASFKASEVLEAMTWYELPTNVEEAYDAPFPSREYMAGVRTFPSLVNELAGVNAEAWDGLTSYEKPFLTIWGGNDIGPQGSCEAQQNFIDNVPGANDKPHVRLPEAGHFLQDDQGIEIANRLVDFYSTNWEDVQLDPCENFDSPIQNEERTQLLIPPSDLRDFRYSEVIPVFECGNGLITEVYNTLSFNDSPEDDWNALDAEELKTQLGAVDVALNGQRHWVINGAESDNPGGGTGFNKTATFGNIQMGLRAQIQGTLSETYYIENAVIRSNTWIFNAGNEIYKLVNPQGEEYIMQSYSRKIVNTQTIEDLASLGSTLNLPEGWSYETERLQEELRLNSNGEAIIIQDELQNSYQKIDDEDQLECTSRVYDNQPTIEESGISYATTPAFEIPEDIQWRVTASAKEIINNEDYKVFLGAGPNAIPDEAWNMLELESPWEKNLDRFLHIDSTTLLRSPSASSNCQGIGCFTPMVYLGHSWIELAQTVTSDYVPCLTDKSNLGIREVPEGHVEISTIKKCQILQFTDEIYQLTDNNGNYYVMHATETGQPTTNVSLPEGWSLEVVSLSEPLIITPFGNEGDCYFNIVIDHLGQGYHQYIYADEVYPSN